MIFKLLCRNLVFDSWKKTFKPHNSPWKVEQLLIASNCIRFSPNPSPVCQFFFKYKVDDNMIYTFSEHKIVASSMTENKGLEFPISNSVGVVRIFHYTSHRTHSIQLLEKELWHSIVGKSDKGGVGLVWWGLGLALNIMSNLSLSWVKLMLGWVLTNNKSLISPWRRSRLGEI